MFPTIERLTASAYTVPTDEPESDGTLAWDSTTIVVVEARAGGQTGLGYTYTHPSAAGLINSTLADVVTGLGAGDIGAAWQAVVHAARNLGRPGLASAALSAIDVALWDLKARLLGVPLTALLPAFRESVPVYGSGGFTSYSLPTLERQLAGWVADGMTQVKMKVGRDPDQDEDRVRAARAAIGDADLFVDANGAWSRKQALRWADVLAACGVTWLEEPVSSDDLDGLRLLRDRAPAGMDVAAGEYGYDLMYFRRMLDAGAVDCLQADVTRCGGITGFLAVAALCDAHTIDLSAHTAPSVSAHASTGVWHLRHLEYFHDHVRLEHMLFDGALSARDGHLHPDPSRPGLGLQLKTTQAEQFRVA
ncbi:enolase C-terminal domain-like protein [Blastococcus capsensis]|uniref:enolase C-terminal domain-like protein n=1 Tax=Blastococcus capsensis TaxID=1564163 RepID=UPI002541980D|nr:enolase C-terminal domain-like protein [Blastococcus capsensis]MDK3258725.1 enolase C-terminal domain-like protein [Blastococcus capsensis]